MELFLYWLVDYRKGIVIVREIVIEKEIVIVIEKEIAIVTLTASC